MGALIVHDDVLSKVSEKLEKYESLVWFARKPLADDEEWEGVPEDIKQGALNAVARVEEHYVDEVDELRGEHGSWSHGFNSGVLAALRYVLHAAAEGTDAADELWPDLDT